MHPRIGRVICALRKERGLRQKELAELARLKQPNLSRIEAGTVQPRRLTLERIARALGVSYAELVSHDLRVTLEERWGESMFPPVTPVLSNQSSGDRIPIFQTASGYSLGVDASGRPDGPILETVSLPGLPTSAFGVIVFGDSMQTDDRRDSFHHGDTVLFADGVPVPGCFAFVRLTDAFTFKQVFFDETGRVRLVPLNTHYDERIMDSKDVIAIWPLVRLIRKYE